MSWAFWPIVAIVVSFGAFAVGFYFYQYVKKLPSANQDIDRFGTLIREGSMAFLKTETRVLSVFVFVTAILIVLFVPPIWQTSSITGNILMGVCYVFGAVFSGMAGDRKSVV